MENIFLLEEVLKFQKLSGLISEKVYKSNLKKINNFEGTVLGSLTKELQKEYVKNIHKSSLFNESECKYLKDYFKKYTSINESNIRKHNLLLKEGFIGNVGKFFGDAWNKIKQVYGNIKDFVLKLWDFLKTSAIKVSKAAYTYIKNQFSSKKNALIAYLNKQDHGSRDKELQTSAKLFNFFKGYITKFWNMLSTSVLNNPVLSQMGQNSLKEVFTSRRMFKLFENEIVHPEQWIKNPAAQKIISILMEIVKALTSPIQFILVKGAKFLIGRLFKASNQLAIKLGSGIENIEWIVLPAAVTAALESLPPIHDLIHHLSEQVLGAIFGEATGISAILEAGSIIYMIYAIHEMVAVFVAPVLSKAGAALNKAVGNTEFSKPQFSPNLRYS
jgi:hypothetical protein